MSHGSSVPVRIRGIVYPSMTAAAAEMDVSVAAVWKAINRGTEDGIGLGQRQLEGLICDGVFYKSVPELAKAIGRTPAALHIALSRKKKDADGYILTKGHRIKKQPKRPKHVPSV